MNFDEVQKQECKPIDETPHPYGCKFTQRLEHMIPDTPYNWVVNSNIDNNPMVNRLSQRISEILILLDQIDSLSSFLEINAEKHWIALPGGFDDLARLYEAVGNLEAAKENQQLFNEFLQNRVAMSNDEFNAYYHRFMIYPMKAYDRVFADYSQIPNEPYLELRGVLEVFVTEVSAELAGNLYGIYMLGSLAVGDFDLDSDVDFLVVTKNEITERTSKRLQVIQEKIYTMDCYPAHHLEGSFISIEDLNNWEIVGKKELYYFDNGSTKIEKSVHDNQWHVRWILRERGVTLIGPKPQGFVFIVPPEILRDEMKLVMHERMQEFEESLDQPRCYSNSRLGQPFAVLTFCRMLQTLQTGKVESKKSAAKWAKGIVDARWHKLIEDAWFEREGVRHMVKIKQRAEQSVLEETLEFMRYVVQII